jgi:hypothetical protein
VYHITRFNGISNIRQLASDKTPWNLKGSYGLFNFSFYFVDWLHALGSEPPARQGSPRGETGSALMLRNFFPGKTQDTYIVSTLERRLFITYKTVTKVRYWRSVAQERKSQGIDCCESCAGPWYFWTGVCQICTSILSWPKSQPLWFRKALLRQTPTEHEPYIPDPNTGFLDGYMRFGLKNHELCDLHAKFQKTLSFTLMRTLTT